MRAFVVRLLSSLAAASAATGAAGVEPTAFERFATDPGTVVIASRAIGSLRSLDAQCLLRALAIEPDRDGDCNRQRRRADQHPDRHRVLRARHVNFRRDAFGFRFPRGSGGFRRVPLSASGRGQWTVDGIGHGRLGNMHVRF